MAVWTPAARRRLIEQYLGIAYSIAETWWRRCNERVPREDLRQAAVVGLCMAMERWHPERDYTASGHGTFPVYARPWCAEQCRDLVLAPYECPLYEDESDDSEDADPGGRDRALSSAICGDTEELCPGDRERIRDLVQRLYGVPRAIAQAMGAGLDDDDLVQALRVDLDQVDAVRADLRAALASLGTAEPPPITATQAAHELRVPLQEIHRRIKAGTIAGTKRQGRWQIPRAAVHPSTAPTTQILTQLRLPLPDQQTQAPPPATPRRARDAAALARRRDRLALLRSAQLDLRWMYALPQARAAA